jgi:hypothetical protein
MKSSFKIFENMGDLLFLEFFILSSMNFQNKVSQSCEHVLQFHKK